LIKIYELVGVSIEAIKCSFAYNHDITLV